MEVCERLLMAIRARDYAAIECCFAREATFAALTPHRLREHAGATEAAARYRSWLEPLDDFEVVESDCAQVADRVRIRYRFRGVDRENGHQENEHTGYATEEDGRIAQMNLTCAGFRPLAARTVSP